MSLKNITLFVLLLGLTLLTANTWAMDEEADEGAAQDTRSETADAAVGPDSHIDPPNDGAKTQDSASLAKASQNPVSSLISLPFQNDATFNNGPEDAFVNVLTIKPVIPMGVTENWNLINRAIIPVVYQSEAHQGQTTIGEVIIPGGTTEFVLPGQELGSEFGLGDIIYQGFFTPAKSGKFIWGIGPQVNLPTGTGRMSSDQWALGPAAVLLTMPGNWVIGIIASNVWNIGNGYNDAPDVNALAAQYFINYNMKGGWYLSTAPAITANWEAESGNKWTVPFGGGVGRVFKIGKQPVKMSGSIYYNAIRPDDASDWDLQFTITFLFPK
jgi:hypothetical protein